MNRQDIHQLDLESVEKHQNDHTSVSAWVTKKKKWNIILF